MDLGGWLRSLGPTNDARCHPLRTASAKAPPPDALSTIEAPPKDTAEGRQVTVMLSDLVGSTALSARMDPEDLREVVSTYQKCVAETVRRFENTWATGVRYAGGLFAGKNRGHALLFTNPRRCVNSRQKRKLAHGL